MSPYATAGNAATARTATPAAALSCAEALTSTRLDSGARRIVT